jgi:hypothetical protein
MFIDDSTFYYWLVFKSLINYISDTIVFVPIYSKLRQENYKRNLRIVALGWYGTNTLLGIFGLLIYKYFYHQIVPLYIILWITLSTIAFFAILGFMYAGISFDFFNNPHKLETKRVVDGMIISVMGIVLAAILFL